MPTTKPSRAIIAEGFETDEQLRFLKREGCGEIQGYLYSRPLPAEQATGMLEGGVVVASVASA